MKEGVDFLSSVKDVAQMAGELLGILLVGIGIGIWGAIRRNKSLLKLSWNRDKKLVGQHTRVHEMLTELRVTRRACRCLVFQFHNGGSFADGTSIKRFSVTHESCESSAQSMILESQDVLLTRYMDVIRSLDETPGKIIAVQSLSPSAFRSGLEINSVEYFSVVPLKCLDGITPLGFLCCHCSSGDPLDDIEREGVSQEKLEQLIIEASHNINTHLAYRSGRTR